MTPDIELSKRVSQVESRQQSMGDRLLLMEAHAKETKEAIVTIKDNHLKHVQEAIEKIQLLIADMQKTQAVTGADMKWVKKFVWVIVTAAIANLFGMVIMAFKLYAG